MKILGYKIIKQSDYDELKRKEQILYQFQSLHYWFSGFREVYGLLHSFARGEVNHVNISSVRTEFGKSLNKDDYGKDLNGK